MLKRYLFFPTILAFIMFFWALPALSEMIVDTAWVRRYNGPGNSDDIARSIAVDGFGNVYVTGRSYGSGTNYDYTTIKYHSNGDTAWVRRYNGLGNSEDGAFAMVVGGSGNIYVTGYSYGSGTSHPQDYATITYYPNGDTAWVRRYNGTGNSNDYAYAIAVDNSGNIYVTGGSIGIFASYDYATIKYYANGDTAWVRRYNGPGNSDDVARSIAVDGSGCIYVTGYSTGSGIGYDYATIKYYPNGDTAWLRRYNGPANTDDVANAMGVDSSGNVYVTGESVGNGTNYDYATIKYYLNGETAWVRRYDGPASGPDYAYAVVVDGSKNVYVTGGSGRWGRSYTTIKYEPNGNTAWMKTYGGANVNYNDDAYAIAVDGSGNIYVTGESGGSGTNFDYATIKYWQDNFPIVQVLDSSVFLCASDTIRFTVTATDPDSMDILTLFGPGIPVPVTGISPLSAEVSIYEGSLGIYDYIYTVADSWGAMDVDTSTWTITFNSPPIVVAVDSSLFLCDPDTIRFTVTASDPDIADTITLSGPGMSAPLQGVSLLSANVSIPIDSTGNYSFIYTVSDPCSASSQDTATWMVTVNSQPAPYSLLSPREADSVRIPVTLWWGASVDTCPGQDIRYDLFLSHSPVFSPESTIVYDSLSDTTFSLSLQIKNWYWKVRAYDKWGAERWSTQSWSFYVYLCGDCTTDGVVDVGDVVWEINYLFKSGPPPKPYAAGNCNGDGVVDVSDVVYLINYLFKGGKPPCEP